MGFEPRPHLSCPLACDCPAMASMMASCEYMLIGVLYWAWTMVAFPPGPFTSMGLWVDRAESFRAFGLKLGVYSTLWPPRSGVSGPVGRVVGFRCWGEKEKLPDTTEKKAGQHVVTHLNDRWSCFTKNKARPQVLQP